MDKNPRGIHNNDAFLSDIQLAAIRKDAEERTKDLNIDTEAAESQFLGDADVQEKLPLAKRETQLLPTVAVDEKKPPLGPRGKTPRDFNSRPTQLLPPVSLGKKRS